MDDDILRKEEEHASERRKADESGFTLIELLVVLLIMGVLMAIAIPTYLGSRNHANNTSAQSELSEAQSAAATVYQTYQTYAVTGGASGMATDLGKSTPNLAFTTGASEKNNQISVDTGGTDGQPGTWVSLAAYASDGKCWGEFIPDNGSELYSVTAENPAACTAATTPPSTGAGGWSSGSFPAGTTG